MNCPSCRDSKWYCFLIACPDLSEILDRVDAEMEEVERQGAAAPLRRSAAGAGAGAGMVSVPGD